jgi:hypothetical protein
MNRSAGAPASIWRASVEEEANEETTSTFSLFIRRRDILQRVSQRRRRKDRDFTFVRQRVSGKESVSVAPAKGVPMNVPSVTPVSSVIYTLI